MSEPTLVCDSSADRETWLKERRNGIGASDAPAILGISPFASPLSIAAAKQGLQADDPETELQRWGRLVEPAMIAAFRDETGWLAEPSGKMYRSTTRHREFMMVTLDGAVQRDDGKVGAIECKLKIFGGREWEEEGIPEHVDCQVQHGMDVMGWDFAVVLGLLDGYRLRWRVVERKPELIGDVIVPEEMDFWHRLQNGLPISAAKGDVDATGRALKAFYPGDTGEEIRLEGASWIDMVDAWVAARADEKHAKEAKDRLRHTLAAAMGSATFAVLDDGRRLSLKTTQRDGYAVEPTSFRTLREVAAAKAKRGARR